MSYFELHRYYQASPHAIRGIVTHYQLGQNFIFLIAPLRTRHEKKDQPYFVLDLPLSAASIEPTVVPNAFYMKRNMLRL